MSTKNEALAAWATSDAPTVQPGAEVHQGTTESRAAALAMLLDAADAPADVATIERVTAVGGRPSLAAGRPAGTSPLWQVRAPRELDAAMRARAADEGRTFSEVLRDAASQYLNAHAS